jgi:hypothetical protein
MRLRYNLQDNGSLKRSAWGDDREVRWWLISGSDIAQSGGLARVAWARYGSRLMRSLTTRLVAIKIMLSAGLTDERRLP